MSQIYIRRSSKILMKAVTTQNTNVVRDLLESGVNVNARDDAGNGVLYYSVVSENMEIFNLLLEHGAYVDDVNYKGVRPIDLALMLGRSRHAEILLKHGARASINMFGSVMQRGEVKLMYQYVDLRDRNKNGLSILHLAVTHDDIEGLEIVLRRGGSVNERTLNDGLTALHLASKSAKLKMVQLLLDYGADANLKDEFGFTALHKIANCEYANIQDQVEILELLLASGARVNETSNSGLTALHMAVRNVKIRCIEVLLRNGARSNARDDFYCTPLHKLATNSHNYWAHEKYQVKVAKMLLNTGAKVNDANSDGLTLLHIAATRAQPHMVKLLLQYHANPNVKDNRGYTPLHVLSSLRINETNKHDQIRVIQMLLSVGASVNEVAANGKTALTCAVDSNARGVIRTLVKHMAQNAQGLSGGVSISNLVSIISNRRWVRFYAYCSFEIETMQQLMIHNDLTVYDFLIKDVKQMMRYGRSLTIAESIENGDYQRLFPIYYKSLKSKYQDIQDRRNLQKRSSGVLSDIMKNVIDPTNVVADKILDYLEIHDLKNLMEIYDEPVPVTKQYPSK